MAVTTDLVVAPHPLTADGQRVVAGLVLDPAETLAVLLARHEVVAGEGWEVHIGGAQVPELMWGRTRVRHGQVIEARRRAGKDVARMAAIVVLAYVTLQVGLPAAYLGLQGFAAFAVNVGAFIIGSALINRLLPASRPQLATYKGQTGSTYSLSGARNRMRPYEPLGLLLGRVRVTPDLAAQPYAWFAGDEQYQYLVFHAGINCASVDQLKIGDTLLSAYDDVVVSQAGFPGSSTGLQEWSSVDTVAGGTLTATSSPGGWVTRTSSPGTVRLAVDVAAQLYRMDDNGNVQNETLRLSAEYRQLPSGAWQPLVSAAELAGTAPVLGFALRSAVSGDASAIDVQHGATKLHRGTYERAVPSGQYEVRLRKVTADSTDTRRQNAVEWVSLKSYQPDPANYSGQPRVGVRIKASGQLQGTLDQLNWMAQSAPCPLWDGSAWSTTTTSNPGALFLQLVRGIYAPSGQLLAGLGLADTLIDIEGLKAFMVHCTTRGYTFNHWFDAAMSCGDMLDAIAAAGLGVRSLNSGKVGVVWMDESQPLTGVLSPVRMQARSFAVEYATVELADEVEVSWPDSEGGTWAPKSLRVPVPGLTGAPRDTARQSPVGVTTQAGALLAARLAMAQNVWQRKAISWQMDLEHLDFHRYSVIALSHDLTQWGYSGRLVAAVNVGGTVTLQLDEEVPAGTSGRYIGLQLPNEQGYRVFTVAAFSGTTRSVTLVGAWPSGVALPGADSSNPAHDTVWIYDFTATPGQRLLVTSVEPEADMKGARITAVPLPDEFWTFVRSGAYTALPAPASAPPVVASNIRVLQQRLDLSYDDTTELSFTWDATGPYDHAQVLGARMGEALVLLGETRATRWPSWRVRNDGTYRIVIRPYDALGRPGQYAELAHDVALTALAGGARTYRQESAPGSPRPGDLWTQPSTGEQRRWSGSAWELAATVGATAEDVAASTDIRLTVRGLTQRGNTLSKALGTADSWDSDAYSLDSYAGGAYAIATAATTDKNVIFGLNADAAADRHYLSLDYTWQLTLAGECYAGSAALGWTYCGTYTVGTSFAVVFDGSTIRWIKAGSVMRSMASTDANNLYWDCSFATPGGKLDGCRFGPMSSNSWAAIGGSGKPADGATRNAVTYAASAPTSPVDGDLWCDTSVTPRVWRFRLGGAWQAGASLVTDTAQITDGAQLGLTAVWSGVTGSGRPADGATVNRLTYSPTSPVGAVDGDIWVDTSASPATIKLRTAGSWVSGANLTTNTNQLTDGAALGQTAVWNQVSGTGKPADGATRNAVSYSSSAPSSPTDGDLWCDTSVTPRSWRVRLGGAWQAAASYVTDTAQITDGAQLGLTAVWSGVTGSGKPADGATVNRLTYSSSAPGSPVDGDIWVDTSASPATIKLRTGGAWVSGANLSTGLLAQLNSVGTSQIDPGSAAVVRQATASNVTITGETGVPTGDFTDAVSYTWTPSYSCVVEIGVEGNAIITTPASGYGNNIATLSTRLVLNGTQIGPLRTYAIDQAVGYSTTINAPIQRNRQISVTAGVTYTVTVQAQKTMTAVNTVIESIALKLVEILR